MLKDRFLSSGSLNTPTLSGEKCSPNASNLQPYDSVHICACGKVVLNHPTTLSCGHQFHFKCARYFVFNRPDKQNNSSEEDPQEECPLCELQTENVFSSSQNSHDFKNVRAQESPAERQNSNSTAQKPSTDLHNSFKYITPSTNKYPKRQLRYSNNGSQEESISTQQPSTNFMTNPHCLTGPRVPFSDITSHFQKINIPTSSGSTAKIQQQQCQLVYSPLEATQQSQQTNSNPFFMRNNSPVTIEKDIKGTKISTEDLISQPTELETDLQKNFKLKSPHFIQILSESLLNSNFLHEFGHRDIFLQQQNEQMCYPDRIKHTPDDGTLRISGNISGIEGNLSNDSDLYKKNTSNSSSFLRSDDGKSISFLAGSCNSSSDYSNSQQKSNESFFMRFRRLQAGPTFLEHSFNSSMLSISSDKENARLLTTRRLQNEVIKISLLEGVSFLSPKNFYSDQNENLINNCEKKSDKQLLKLPFLLELQNLFSSKHQELSEQQQSQPQQQQIPQASQKNSQDILLIICQNGFNSAQRYQLVKTVFDLLDRSDQVSLSWISLETMQISKNQSDLFGGKDMAEIFSKEFMRLQSHKESTCQIIPEQRGNLQLQPRTLTLQQFIEEQFNQLTNPRMIQHVVMIGPEEQLRKISGLNRQNSNIENIHNTKKTDILYTFIDTSLQSQEVPHTQYPINLVFEPEQFNSILSNLTNSLKQSQKISIKNLSITFELNPNIPHFKGLNLVNYKELSSAQIVAASSSDQIINYINNQLVQQIPKNESTQMEQEDEGNQDQFNRVIENDGDQIFVEITEQKDNDQVVNTNIPDQIQSFKITFPFILDTQISLLLEAQFVDQANHKNNQRSNICDTYNNINISQFAATRLFNCSVSYTLIYFENDSNMYQLEQHRSIATLYQPKSSLSLPSSSSFPKRFYFQDMSISNMYMLVDYRRENTHLYYDKTVAFAFWNYLKSHTLTQESQFNLYNRYFNIFSEIAVKKHTNDFEEFNAFREYYCQHPIGNERFFLKENIPYEINQIKQGIF